MVAPDPQGCKKARGLNDEGMMRAAAVRSRRRAAPDRRRGCWARFAGRDPRPAYSLMRKALAIVARASGLSHSLAP